MASDTTNFQWKPEYDALLEKIASTEDIEGSDLNELRQIIRHKLEQNVNLFLSTSKGPSPPPPFNPQPSTPDGLRLPPFPPKKLAQLHMYEPPVSYMNEEQAREAKQGIFDLLNEFDDNPPFTIQRLCELLIEPKKHYKTVGKYLRAVEKSILVTSTYDAFPVPPPSAQPTITAIPAPTNGNGLHDISSNFQTIFPRQGPAPSSSVPSSPSFATRGSFTPSTPLFSPIPFLHADARSRSKSRSPPPPSPTPPMTPLALAAELDPVVPEGDKAIGMVDELDDPNPGHMSDKPTPLTVAGGAKPFLGSLEDRFVKSQKPDGAASDEDKENTVEQRTGLKGKTKEPSRKKVKTEEDKDVEGGEKGGEPSKPEEKEVKTEETDDEMDTDTTGSKA
ncbi:PPP4R2-domain-containing protein [Coprinopsis marcescibilis]|uniref:PPP4R2-domain-containing protein n=1 Tax=Coprinopsis marcescibilis TaxID=230819 RepID=A0A5C3L406_COPMA|nr:PPP4R2-domain-containing protein [Coprinopsis marcescibilis]